MLYFTQTSFYIPGLSSSSLFYFGIGAFLSLSKLNLVNTLSRHKEISWVVFGLLFIVEVICDGHNTFWGNILYPFYVLVGVVSLLSLPSYSGGGKFSRATFFIFAFHIFLLPFVGIYLSHLMEFITTDVNVNSITFANNYPLLVMIEYILKVCIAVFGSILLYKLLERYFHGVCKILCGR